MKRYGKTIISFVLVVMMSMTMFVPAFASGEISVYLDNEKIQFDVAPLLVNGRTMVPMRAIFEKLGANVDWNNDTRTAIAQKGDVNISIAIDDTTLYKLEYSDDKLQTMYNSLPEASGIWLKAQHILIQKTDDGKGLSKAKTILSDLKKNPSKFEEYMEKYNEDPGVANQPDGYIFNDGMMVDEFYKGALHLNEGAISEIVESVYGYHIIKKVKQWNNGIPYTEIEQQVKETYLYSNIEEVKLDVSAQLVGGRTLVPLRAVSEAFDCDVQWDGDTRTVNIFTKPDYKAIQQDYAFDVLKTFVLVNQTEVINEDPAYTRTSNDLYGSTKYIIDFNAQGDAVTLSMVKKYKDAYMYSFITLHRSNQTYFCTFSFYGPSNKTNAPDFRGTYNIDANGFGNNTYIDFKNVSGDSANINSYQKLARALVLEMLSYTDFVFNDNEFFKTFNNCSMADFGFDLTNVTPADFVEPADFVASGNTQNNASSSNYQGGSGGGYTINTKITLSSFPLYLYADDGTGTFLGEISSNKYDTDSIANEYGDYGSKYQTKSIFNQYGNYGSKYSQYSVFNEYATNPPKILDKNGKVVGYLTANKYIRDAISYEEMMVLLKKFNK